jgi:hypothetical protein
MSIRKQSLFQGVFARISLGTAQTSRGAKGKPL